MRTFSPGHARDKSTRTGRTGRIGKILSQTVRKKMGHLGREYANRLVRPKQGNFSTGPNGTKGRAG
ncbi:hypothetical protein KI387_002594, partial [Taxus chinensis]